MGRLTIPVQLRFSDMDAYQHINNARMFTILEECRIAAFWSQVPGDEQYANNPEAAAEDAKSNSGDQNDDGAPPTKAIHTGPGSGTNTYVARQEIEYLAPVPYRLEPLPISMWISKIGGASFDICYEVPGPDGVAVRASTTLVLIDENTGRPKRLSDEMREAWKPFMDDPVQFRR